MNTRDLPGYGDAATFSPAAIAATEAALAAPQPDALEQARAEEREACAKVCDSLVHPSFMTNDPGRMWILGTTDCAAAIRAIRAIRAAEAQQAEPVRLTRESVARAIWGVRREYEDRCDMELEDMGESHPVWDEADAVLAAAELTQTDPTWLTIEQARNAERYAYLRSQHEGSVAASFAVFAPEQPIGEFGPVGSMPGELDAAIDSAMRADSHKVEG